MTGHKKRINRPRGSRSKNKKNKSKRNDKRELVVVKDSSSSDSGMNKFGVWMIIAMLTGCLLEYQGYEPGLQYLLDTMYSWGYMINNVIGTITSTIPWYLWAAPMLWTMLMVVSVKGRSLLHRMYPEEAMKSLQPELRTIRRYKEQYWKRFNKKRSRFLQKFNNEPVQSNENRQEVLGKRQVWKEPKRYERHNTIYHQKRSRGSYWRKQCVRKLRNA